MTAKEGGSDIHKETGARDLDQADDPFQLFRAWLALAEQEEPNDPQAMTLATVDAQGMPNARILLLRLFDERGFGFFTNTQSVKGLELADHPVAALCFHWKSILRQVRVRGRIQPLEDAEADQYFAGRPRGSQIGAWASAQSQELESRDRLEQAVADFDEKFAGGEVPRPPHWLGYRLEPLEMEFWANGAFRLHDRILFVRPSVDTQNWSKTRLYP